MSTTLNGAGDGAGDGSKRNPSRSVSLLTPEQLARKRAQDRESQRQTRERVKRMIKDLETKVDDLTYELHNTKLENAALQSRSDLISQYWQRDRNIGPPVHQPRDLYDTEKPPTEVVLRDDTTPYDYSSALTHASSNSSAIDSQPAIGASCRHAGVVDPSLLSHHGFPMQTYISEAMCVQVWEARPLHLDATCKLDKIFMDIVEQRRLFGPLGGNVIEFSNEKFPSVEALLNPDQHSSTLPLTSTIVSKVINHLTPTTMPEQIAIMYIMCILLRWQVTCSREDFYTLPHWLRPTATQLVTGHPAWVDVFPWPEGRDSIIQNFEIAGNWEYFKNVCNTSISVNWPYDPAHTLIAVSNTEYIVNPIFTSHIRVLSNWTIGASFVEAFPEVAKYCKTGRPPRITPVPHIPGRA